MPTPGPTAVSLHPTLFTDVTASAGIDFLHHEPSAEIVPLGGGMVVFDFNKDGFDDIYVTDSGGGGGLTHSTAITETVLSLIPPLRPV